MGETPTAFGDFHLADKFVSGFTPLVPTEFANHRSQVTKAMTVHHFATELLRVSTIREQISQDEVEALYKFFIVTSAHRTIKKGHQQKYQCFLIEIASFIEERVTTLKNTIYLRDRKHSAMKIGLCC
ncbi:hypothetical protein CU097_011503 [Rhizopus azygosporus]|uniref:Uncharacterized protein n=2 Tax=Rhizopus TaxID=4842 RepID=A0A367JX36_RHIAZ|nr:hypothetical protein BCV71DRAFT_18256 [Rhizopus microsporus]RCH94467.1 hypothetical protein CU097_011503 [Rhizopus azygosporus]